MDRLQQEELKRELYLKGKVYFARDYKGDVINPIFKAIDEGTYNPHPKQQPEQQNAYSGFENKLLSQLKQGVKIRLGDF